MKFQKLPKTELHLHLDCSLSYEAVSKLNPAISKIEYDKNFPLPPKCKDLADFLSRVPNLLNLLQTETGLRIAVDDLFQQLKADNVIYAEIRFAPLLHLEQGLQAETVVEIVNDAFDKASEQTGIESRIILCTLRHFTEAQGLQTASLIKKFRGSRVAALDLAADEAGFPINTHITAFEYAMEHNIPRTAHAGEARGAESVWETLRNLKPSRIGHGVRSIEDAELVNHLRDERIHLEICPTCNVQISIFDSFANHSINKLYNAGVSVGVNTDGRTLPNITLTEEYEKLHQTFGWGKTDFLRCNLNALSASFIPDDIKNRLKLQLEDAYA